MDGMDGLTHDVSTVVGESTDIIITEEISALSSDPTTLHEPLRIPTITNNHCNNSPSISISSFSNRTRGGRRFFSRSASKFGSCDSNSYCLSCMSVIFVVLGAFITVTTLGGTKFSLGHMWSVGPIFFCVGVMMAMKCYVYLRSKREIEMLFIAELVCQQLLRLEDEGRRRLLEMSQQYFNSNGITRDIFTLVSEQVRMNRSYEVDNQMEHIRSQNIQNNHSPQHHSDIALQEISREVLPLSRTSVTASPNSIRNQPPAYESITKPDFEGPPPTYSEAIALMAQPKVNPPITEHV